MYCWRRWGKRPTAGGTCRARYGFRTPAPRLRSSRTRRPSSSLTVGLVRRERDPEDNRVVRMYLTEEGRLRLRGLPELNSQVEARIREVLSAEELEELQRMLGLLAEGMKE